MKRKLLIIVLISLFFTGSVYAEAQNKISLDIKGMDIVDVAKMLASRAGMNIVVGKNVTGKVTLFLKDVDVWDAFEIVLLANELAYEKKDKIINVMTQKNYELKYGERFKDQRQVRIKKLEYASALELAKSLNQIKTSIGKIVVDEGTNTLVLIDTERMIEEMEGFIESIDLPTETRIFDINYAQVNTLNEKIQESVTKGVGSVKIDERTNKMAVTDFPEKIDEIAQLIKAFDEKTPQVLIDAQIIEISPSETFDVGIDWDYWIEKNFRMSTVLTAVTGTDKLSIGTNDVTPGKPGRYKAIIDMLRTIGETNILSSPRIMALNNQEAKILVGTKDAYITSTTSLSGDNTVTAQSVNFVDVGIKLFVTPTINNDGFVTMKIKPEVSSATRTDITSEGQITQVPIVTTSETETTVMIKDGVTIIIGGLKREQLEKTEKRIPIFGDIPFLGALFRSKTEEMNTTELVILLTPHIMSGESSFTEISQLHPKDGAIARMDDKGKIITEKIVTKLEAPEFTASSYYNFISEKVRKLTLSNKPGGRQGRVKVGFTLSSKGILIDEPQVLETDNPDLNVFAIEAVKFASPFPAFPKSLEEPQQSFKIFIEYK